MTMWISSLGLISSDSYALSPFEFLSSHPSTPQTGSLMTSVASGNPLAVVPSRDKILESIDIVKPTHFSAVPLLINRVSISTLPPRDFLHGSCTTGSRIKSPPFLRWSKKSSSLPLKSLGPLFILLCFPPHSQGSQLSSWVRLTSELLVGFQVSISWQNCPSKNPFPSSGWPSWLFGLWRLGVEHEGILLASSSPHFSFRFSNFSKMLESPSWKAMDSLRLPPSSLVPLQDHGNIADLVVLEVLYLALKYWSWILSQW